LALKVAVDRITGGTAVGAGTNVGIGVQASSKKKRMRDER
jgi:hypothetical protein